MSGHQAAFWHAGIAAKVFALDAAAARSSAASAWIVVDQDVGAPGRIRYPNRTPPANPDQPARLGAATLELLEPRDPSPITGRQRAAAPSPTAPTHAASPSIAPAIASMREALARHATQASRALQVTRAALDLLAPAGDNPAPVTLITATSLASTTLFSRLLQKLRSQTTEAIDAYNAAVRRHPHARLRPLASHPTRGREVPLWRINPHGLREPAYWADLDAPPDTLAPRALLMTALLRWAACDLFIHGLGGGLYDPVMEEWLGNWLGITDLAPAVVATATRLLPLVDDPPPTPSQVAHARWAAHHARHNPDPAMKRTLAAAVRTARTPTDRAARFHHLHAWLADQRSARAADLAALDAHAAQLTAHADLSAIVFDRTWPFPLLPSASMRSLRDDIHAAF